MTNVDRYARVTCILIVATKDAICVDTDPDGDEIVQAWIPKSLIHGGDLLRLGNDHSTDRVTFRLMEWKARELGL
nr:hypothetical protein [Mesorhizobium sp.]